MNVSLTYDYGAMPGKAHDRECVRPRLSHSGQESVAQTVEHEVRWQDSVLVFAFVQCCANPCVLAVYGVNRQGTGTVFAGEYPRRCRVTIACFEHVLDSLRKAQISACLLRLALTDAQITAPRSAGRFQMNVVPFKGQRFTNAQACIQDQQSQIAQRLRSSTQIRGLQRVTQNEFAVVLTRQ